MDARHAMVFGRAVFLALVIWAATKGAWGTVTFSSALFLGSLFLVWLSRRDREYAALDALVSLTFASAIAVSLFSGWEAPLLGFDKLYHLLGGACLAWFASILFRRLEGWRYAAAVLLTVLVLGATWELLELAFALLPPPVSVPFNPHGWPDSALDLVADLLGGLLALVSRRGKLFK